MFPGEYSLVKIIEYMGFKHIVIICDGKLYQNSEHVRNIIVQLEEQHELFLKLYDYPFEPSYQMLDKMMNKIKINDDFKEIDVIVNLPSDAVGVYEGKILVYVK